MARAIIDTVKDYTVVADGSKDCTQELLDAAADAYAVIAGGDHCTIQLPETGDIVVSSKIGLTGIQGGAPCLKGGEGGDAFDLSCCRLVWKGPAGGTVLQTSGFNRGQIKNVAIKMGNAGIGLAPSASDLNDPTKEVACSGAKFIDVSVVDCAPGSTAIAIGTDPALTNNQTYQFSEDKWSGIYLSAAPPPAWAPAISYVAGAYTTNLGNNYVCATPGISAAQGASGPTGNGTGIQDGGVVWNWVPPSTGIKLLSPGNCKNHTWATLEADYFDTLCDFTRGSGTLEIGTLWAGNCGQLIKCSGGQLRVGRVETEVSGRYGFRLLTGTMDWSTSVTIEGGEVWWGNDPLGAVLMEVASAIKLQHLIAAYRDVNGNIQPFVMHHNRAVNGGNCQGSFISEQCEYWGCYQSGRPYIPIYDGGGNDLSPQPGGYGTWAGINPRVSSKWDKVTDTHGIPYQCTNFG